jgi:hypothetical protein
MKRHELLGRNLVETVEKTLDSIERGIRRHTERIQPGQPEQEWSRLRLIGDALSFAVMEHLGYGLVPRLRERLDAGVDQTLEYYLGDWWKGCESDARKLDWSRPDRELAWYDVLKDGLLLAALTDRWADITRICSWFRPGINEENQFEMKGYELQHFYYAVALSLQDPPLPEAKEIWAFVRAGKAKRAKHLCEAWDAALARNQKAFDKSLKAAVTHFLKMDAKDAPNPCFWVARDASFVWLFAEHQGLTFPPLAPELEAAVVRRQTVFP